MTKNKSFISRARGQDQDDKKTEPASAAQWAVFRQQLSLSCHSDPPDGLRKNLRKAFIMFCPSAEAPPFV